MVDELYNKPKTGSLQDKINKYFNDRLDDLEARVDALEQRMDTLEASQRQIIKSHKKSERKSTKTFQKLLQYA